MCVVFFIFGIPVNIRVVDQKRDRTDWSIKMPEYEIISGPSQGVRKKSTIGSSFGTHKTGTELQGLYLKGLGFIESATSLKLTGLLGLTIIGSVLVYNYFN